MTASGKLSAESNMDQFMCIFAEHRIKYGSLHVCYFSRSESFTPLPPLLLSESSSQVYVFNIVNTMAKLIGFWGGSCWHWVFCVDVFVLGHLS